MNEAQQARLILMAEKLYSAFDMLTDGPDESDVAWAQARIHDAMELAREHRRESPFTGWVLPAESVNKIVASRLNELISRARWSHMADVKLRSNGNDVWFQADWIKYMRPVGKFPPATAAKEPT